MMDLLLPRTDAAVLVQIAILAVAGIGAIVATRKHPEFRILAIGIVLMGYAGIGVRAIH